LAAWTAAHTLWLLRRLADKNIGILLDTKGPEIRTGFFKESCGGKIHLKVRIGGVSSRVRVGTAPQ